MEKPGKVLMIVICSNTKKPGGRQGYVEDQSVGLGLQDHLKTDLLDSRASVLQLIKRGGKTGDGRRLLEQPGNRQLAKGPDFGGASTGGEYLPAAERYQGSFFSELGAGGAQLLSQGPASVLILSGLYGMILPSEPIQEYTCHFNDHPKIRSTWTEKQNLSQFVAGFIRRQGIAKVFDFTALHSHRYLLDWDLIGAAAPGGVLHLFGERSTGDSLLGPLGAVARMLLETKTEREICCLQSEQFIETPSERIYLHKEGVSTHGLPTGLAEEVALFDACNELVGMARSVCGKLASMDAPRSDCKSLAARVDAIVRAGRLPRQVGAAMKEVVQWSEQVESGYSFTAMQIPRDVLRKRYDTVVKWTQKG